MNKFKLLSVLMGIMLFSGTAMAADIKIFYTDTCPHCHHAREFFTNELVYEYPSINISGINVMTEKNMPDFQAALKKCGYESGGVPLILVGDKCFQGYADSMSDELRNAVAVDLTDAIKTNAKTVRAAMSVDAEKYRTANPISKNPITEIGSVSQKKTDSGSNVKYFYGFIGLLFVGLGFVLLRGRKKK